MEKPAISIILYVIIASTLINIFFFSNKKLINNPKAKQWFRVSFIAGIVVFIITLAAYLYVK